MAKEARLNLDVDLSALDLKIEELREVTAIANGALKDLRAAIKESRGIAAETADVLRKEFEEAFRKAGKETLDEWAKLTIRGINMAEERVNKRFDKLGDILMGEENKDNREPLTKIVREWMKRRETPEDNLRGRL